MVIVNSSPVIISVDSREKDTEFLEYLEKYGALFDEGFFEIGDLGIKGEVNFVIEHKSVEDLGVSLANGRLFKQIRELVINAGEEYQPILLVVGDIWKLWKIRGYSPWQIAAVLNAIQFSWGVTIMYAHNNMFAALRLIALAKKYQNPDKDKKPHPMRFLSKKPVSAKDAVLYILEGFPGISAVRARKILAHYKTLDAVICAMRDGSINEIAGIGKKITENVQKVFDYNIDEV